MFEKIKLYPKTKKEDLAVIEKETNDLIDFIKTCNIEPRVKVSTITKLGSIATKAMAGLKFEPEP